MHRSSCFLASGEAAENAILKNQRKYIALIGVIVGLVLEFVNQGLLDLILPIALNLDLPFLSQDASPNPSGYGIGYFISVISILYSIVGTIRESASLREDIVDSDSIGEGGVNLRSILNPMFMIFWILSSIFLWPLLPFQLLNLGLSLLYIMPLKGEISTIIVASRFST